MITNFQNCREPRLPVRLPDRASSELFPGWGPRF
jgi:hypothetical protein